jgi:hypothetical protein
MPSKYNPVICEGCQKEKDFECTVYRNPWLMTANYLGGPCPINPPIRKSVKAKTKGQQKQGRSR